MVHQWVYPLVEAYRVYSLLVKDPNAHQQPILSPSWSQCSGYPCLDTCLAMITLDVWVLHHKSLWGRKGIQGAVFEQV